LSREYDIPIGTISTWDEIEKRKGGLNLVKRGRGKGIPMKDYKERYEILKKVLTFLEDEAAKKKVCLIKDISINIPSL
jgi:hypothetical protein